MQAFRVGRVVAGLGKAQPVAVDGGVARRLTTHPGQETHAAISPDGERVASAADYAGPTATYALANSALSAGYLPKAQNLKEDSGP